MGGLFVLEGVDGSGKSTQFTFLCQRLDNAGKKFTRLVFPQYAEPSSALIKMYLSGEFGNDPENINAYAASAFFAVDRYASFIKAWNKNYRAGEIILTDRYTTSNAIHQGSKLPYGKYTEYLDWLYDFEHKKMGLPVPDVVFYMDISPETALKQRKQRETETGSKSDIHESDDDYLKKCCHYGKIAAEYYKWTKIRCDNNCQMRTVSDINDEIISILEMKIGAKF